MDQQKQEFVIYENKVQAHIQNQEFTIDRIKDQLDQKA